MEYWIKRGCDAWDGVILDKRSADEIRTSVIDRDEVYQLPKSDYGGCANDEEFIQAKSTIPNILYKLNGTKVDCVIDEQGNVTDFEFEQAPKDPAVAKELERCLGMLLTSGMRHPKYLFRSKSGLMVSCSGVRNSVCVCVLPLYGIRIVTVGMVLAMSNALSTLNGNFIIFIMRSSSL